MDDLISRHAAIDALHMHLMYRMGTDSNKERLDKWISSLPSAQPEIIRCKECKYRDADDFCAGRGYPNALVPDDGFCDKGERREDG